MPSEYRRKRNPSRTPEPFSGSPSVGDPVFVVQRHRARALHYDFRLERDGALASWAVPKGVPLELGVASPGGEGRGSSARLRELRGRDPCGRVRRWDGRALGLGDVRARRRQARRWLDGRAPRLAPVGHVDARAGVAWRQQGELAPDPQGCRRVSPPLSADARDAGDNASARRGAGSTSRSGTASG